MVIGWTRLDIVGVLLVYFRFLAYKALHYTLYQHPTFMGLWCAYSMVLTTRPSQMGTRVLL